MDLAFLVQSLEALDALRAEPLLATFYESIKLLPSRRPRVVVVVVVARSAADASRAECACWRAKPLLDVL